MMVSQIFPANLESPSKPKRRLSLDLFFPKPRSSGQLKRDTSKSFVTEKFSKNCTKIHSDDGNTVMKRKKSHVSSDFKTGRLQRSQSTFILESVQEGSDQDADYGDVSFSSGEFCALDSDASFSSCFTPTSSRRFSAVSFQGLFQSEKSSRKQPSPIRSNKTLRRQEGTSRNDVIAKRSKSFTKQLRSAMSMNKPDASSSGDGVLDITNDDLTPTKNSFTERKRQATSSRKSLDILNRPFKRNRRRSSTQNQERSSEQPGKRRRPNYLQSPSNMKLNGDAIPVKNMLIDFLKKRSRLVAFRAFLQKEFSEENLDFWVEVENYRKHKSNKQCKLAPVIYDTYVAVDAPREINIDARTRTTVKMNLTDPDCRTFDLAQTRIYTLMEKDSFRRFLAQE